MKDYSKRTRAIKEVWGAIKALKKTLEQVGEDYPVNIAINIDGSTGKPTTTAKVETVTITHDTETGVYVITADTKGHAEEHGNDLQDGGCSCESTGETQVTCDCGPGA